MKIAIIAGEASGDQLGASLIEAIKQQCPEAQFEGIAGSKMQAAGCHALFDIERLSVMGLVEPLKRLPDLLKLRKAIIKHFTSQPPDVFIGIDAPDFNLSIERQLKLKGIKTVHYVSPSVWAWRQYRVKKIAKSVDLMLTLFPFEADFYKQHAVPVKYVGHPLADSTPLQIDVRHARSVLGLDKNAHYVALFSGSRKQEARYLLETYILAAKQLYEQHPDLKFISSQVNQARYDEFKATCERLAPELPVHVFIQQSHQVMAAADYVIVTSGTATLEAMLYKKPMVIAYRLPAWVYSIARWIVKTPYIGLPNIIASERLVPELIQHEATPAAIAEQVASYMTHSERTRKLEQQFTDIHRQLRCNAARQAADAVLSIIPHH